MKSNKNKIFILLADDDEDDRFLFREAVAEVGIKIRLEAVKNGEELMEQLFHSENDLPDIIILDINMPLKNGFECLAEIKRNSLLKEIPIIIYSTSNYTEQIDKAYEAGASFYFPKPDSFDSLVEAIKKIYEFTLRNIIPSKENFLLSYQSE